MTYASLQGYAAEDPKTLQEMPVEIDSFACVKVLMLMRDDRHYVQQFVNVTKLWAADRAACKALAEMVNRHLELVEQYGGDAVRGAIREALGITQ